MTHRFDKEQIEGINTILQHGFVDQGVHCVFLVDMAGNDIAYRDGSTFTNAERLLPALAASNFAAVNAMARIIGDDQFDLIFHKGKNENIHFRKVTMDLLLVCIFGSDFPLGLLRILMNESIKKLRKILFFQDIFSGGTFNGDEIEIMEFR